MNKNIYKETYSIASNLTVEELCEIISRTEDKELQEFWVTIYNFFLQKRARHCIENNIF